MYKMVPNALALILIAVVGVSIIVVINSDIKKSEIELETSEAELNVINAAHIIRECFSTDGVVSEDFLELVNEKTICEICRKSFGGLCNLDIGAKVEDLDGTGEWKFGYSGSRNNKHEIFVNIVHDTGRITVGRLYAEL